MTLDLRTTSGPEHFSGPLVCFAKSCPVSPSMDQDLAGGMWQMRPMQHGQESGSRRREVICLINLAHRRKKPCQTLEMK